MKILKMNSDYKFLMEIIFAMQRVPDADKRYIKDSERKDLLEMATLYCIQSFKDLMKKHAIEQRNDHELLSLIVEIYKAHKKMKTVSQKESSFSGVLVDTYKAYANGKVWLQENVNYLDSANKFCVSLTNGLKNQEKQQQLTGQRQTLEELGLKNLTPSLSKACTAMPSVIGPMVVQPSLQTGDNISSNMQVRQAHPIAVTSIATITTTTATTMTTGIASTPITSTTTIPATISPSVNPTNASPSTVQPSITSRPRGRPPGSKNQTSKADKSAALQQQKMMASLLQPMAGALPNLELIAKMLDPSVSSVVMALLAEPNFMKTLAMFPDQNSRTTLLREYFTISKYPNISQLIDGFNVVYNCLVVALQQQSTQSTSNAQPTVKQSPKVDKPLMSMATASISPVAATATMSSPMPSQASAMSIFPTANKPHSSLLNTSPSKSTISPSIPASITPIPTIPSSSNSLLKPGASTVISIGSGQLTITPSVSITPNPTKPTSVLQIPSPSFSMQQTPQSKFSGRQSAGDKPIKEKASKAQRLSQSPFAEMPQFKVENLPKSLSIIPSITPSSGAYMPPMKTSTPNPINTDLLTKKQTKQTKSKKKLIDTNAQFVTSTPLPTKIPKMDTSHFNKAMANQQLQSQLSSSLPINSSAMNQISFLSHYEQFLTGAPQTTLAAQKSSSKANTTVSKSLPYQSAQQQKPQPGIIKVKQLEQLQGRQQTVKIDEKQKPTKGKQQICPPQNMTNLKSTSISGSPTVLNAYGTTISSISSGSQSASSSFSSIQVAASNHPATVQIR